MRHRVRIGLLAILVAGTLGLAGCGQQSSNSNGSNSSTSQTIENITNKTNLADLNYQSGQSAYVNVNHGKSTLQPSDWKKVHVGYANLDKLNRTSTGNTAYLDSQNVANDSLRQTQTVKPTGWHQKFIDNQAIINRGHLIAYSLSKGISIDGKYNPASQSGDQDNPKNLFTQTAFSNQKVQTIFETKVRNALKNGERVIYQVKPIFRGEDLMARGVQMQAISTDGKLNFNVYLFNVQPGVKFDYSTGRSTIDHGMQVPTPKDAPNFHSNSSVREGEHMGNMIYHNHHWIRDYLIYRGVRHAIDRHYEHKRYLEYERSGFHQRHNFGFHHRRW